MSEGELERTLFHWHAVIARAPNGWARDFALSIEKASRWRRWRPTDRQAQIMRRMVGELFSGVRAGTAEVIER